MIDYTISFYKGRILHREVERECCLGTVAYSSKPEELYNGVTKVAVRIKGPEYLLERNNDFYSLHLDAFKPYKEYLEPHISNIGRFVFDPREISYRKLRTLFSIWRVPTESLWFRYSKEDLKDIPPEHRLLLFTSFYKNDKGDMFSTEYFPRGHSITTEDEVNIRGKHSKVLEWLDDRGDPVNTETYPAFIYDFSYKLGTTIKDYTNPTLLMIAEEFYK